MFKKIIGNISLKLRLRAGFFVLSSLLVFSNFFSSYNLTKIRENQNLINQTLTPAFNALNSLDLNLEEAKSHLDSYVYNPKDESIKDFNKSWDNANHKKSEFLRLAAHIKNRPFKKIMEQSIPDMDKIHELQQSIIDDVKNEIPSKKISEKLNTADTISMKIDTNLFDSKDAKSLTNLMLKNKLKQVNEASNHFDLINYIMWAVLILSWMIAAIIGWVSVRAIFRPLDELNNSVSRLAAGDKNLVIEATKRNDELGVIARSLDSVRAHGVLSARIQAAVNNISGNVIISSPEGKILLANNSALNLLKVLQKEIREKDSSFSIDDISSSSTHAFLTPSEREGLEHSQTPLVKQISFGTYTISLTAIPARNSFGDYLGFVIELKDMTSDLKFESEIQALIQSSKEGDLDRRIDLAGQSGFLEKFGIGLNTRNQIWHQMIEELDKAFQELSKGNMTVSVHPTYDSGKWKTIGDNANNAVDKIRDTLGKAYETIQNIILGSSHILTGAESLARRSEQQASTLEETAASMEELSSTVKHNAENSQQVSQLAHAAKGKAEKGGEIVGHAIEAISHIEESSSKMTEIISVIEEIAFQTNLLALNAAVEAARAGEAGKGFAVVADEVRSLAQRSAQASKQIKTLILDSNQQVKDGVSLVHQTGSTLKEIVDSIKQVADLITEIANASREQSYGVEQINVAVNQLDEVTQKNASMAQESTVTAQALSDQSQNLLHLMDFFSLGEKTNDLKNSIKKNEDDARTKKAAAELEEMKKPIRKRPSAPPSTPSSLNGSKPNGHLNGTSKPSSSGSDDDWAEF
jgi:methyl-accepting chemotaxis protein